MGTGNRAQRQSQMGRALEVIVGSATAQLLLALLPITLAVLLHYEAAEIHALVTNEVAILALVLRNERHRGDTALRA